ncbi:unnamed protein product [Soboliphyme baturini]|uniref:Calmodulin n=1 Tax=Soboliphyme baturini TaxID=241478 RepID=A0A183IMD4_9BILA|nr:unnamed protein product [Soboliphyme baturini]
MSDVEAGAEKIIPKEVLSVLKLCGRSSKVCASNDLLLSSIDFKQLQDASQVVQELSADELRDKFRCLDYSGNGFLTLEQLMCVLRKFIKAAQQSSVGLQDLLERSIDEGHKADSDCKSVEKFGFFSFDVEGDMSILVCHRYELILATEQNVQISIRSLKEIGGLKLQRHCDVWLFVVDAAGNVVGFSDHGHENDSVYFSGVLSTGTYFILPFTSQCTFRPTKAKETGNNPNLFIIDANGALKLAKELRMVLMNIFDLCDLDGNGTISREEFDIYSLRTGDKRATDNEWQTIIDSFSSKNHELTLKGFLDLTQMEAEDSAGDTADMWTSLEAMGCNKSLEFDRIAPYRVCVSPEKDLVSFRVMDIQPWITIYKNAILRYFFENAHYLLSDQSLDVYLFKTRRLAASDVSLRCIIDVQEPSKFKFSESIPYPKVAPAQSVQERGRKSPTPIDPDFLEFLNEAKRKKGEKKLAEFEEMRKKLSNKPL